MLQWIITIFNWDKLLSCYFLQLCSNFFLTWWVYLISRLPSFTFHCLVLLSEYKWFLIFLQYGTYVQELWVKSKCRLKFLLFPKTFSLLLASQADLCRSSAAIVVERAIKFMSCNKRANGNCLGTQISSPATHTRANFSRNSPDKFV
jgi:hypothetical protein